MDTEQSELSGKSDNRSLFWYIVLFLAFISPILWQISKKFRYYSRVILYYCCIIVNSIIVILPSLWKPFDADNYYYVKWCFLYLTKGFNITWDLRKEDEKNLEHTDKPFIIVANHQSTLDLMGMMAVWPDRCSCLVKKEIKYTATFGLSAALSGCVFVDRFNKDKAIEVMQKTVDYVKNENVCLWVFPEGTRNTSGIGMLPFKKGAFHLAIQAQIPIVPVVFSSYKPFYDPKEYKFNSSGYCMIRALEPVSTEGMTQDDVTKVTESTRENMLNVLNEINQQVEQKYADGLAAFS